MPAPAPAAVFVAAKNKMDLSLGVAIGSSVQVGGADWFDCFDWQQRVGGRGESVSPSTAVPISMACTSQSCFNAHGGGLCQHGIACVSMGLLCQPMATSWHCWGSLWPACQLCTVVCCFACLKIGLFAVPFVTIVGWIMGHPFSLGFDPFAGANTTSTCLSHTQIHTNLTDCSVANLNQWRGCPKEAHSCCL